MNWTSSGNHHTENEISYKLVYHILGKETLLIQYNSYLDNIWIRSTLMWFIVFCILQQHLVHISAGILEKFIGAVEDYESNFTVA